MSMELPANSLISSRRRRRPVQKSFLGCVQCKARKIKCDETRPSCSRCTEKGINCPGVLTQPRIRWSEKYEVYQSRQAASQKKRSPLPQDRGASQVTYQVSPTSESICATTDTNPGLWATDADIQNSDVPFSDSNRGRCTTEEGECIRNGINSAHSTANVDIVTMGELGHDAMNTDGANPFLDDSNLCVPSLGVSQYNSHPSDAATETSQGVAVCGDVECPPLTFYSASSPCPPSAVAPRQDDQSFLPVGLVDITSELVDVYFSIVCRAFSTFDSKKNLFRSFVDQKWQRSISMFYAMLSMAAAKLARQMPSLRVRALEYQSLALQHLHSDVSRASGWSTELLFIVLMLGLSTSWHDITDLGITHLKAFQHALLDNRVENSCEFGELDFFKEALVYWEMVICSVNDEVSVHDHLKVGRPQPDQSENNTSSPSGRIPRIMPHPWTGVASAPQALFARIAQNIRQIRSFSKELTNPESILCRPVEFRGVLDTLEEELWLLELPQLHEIASTGDENTPAIHHLLLAEAYMFANFYQLYYTFPDLRRRRAKLISENVNASRLPDRSWAQCQARSWYSILNSEGGVDGWLKFLGRNAIIRLEQIQITSGTSCVHALLLLVGSGALSVAPELAGSDEEEEILRNRQFVLDRLSQISDSILSEPIHHVKSVVANMFRLLDVGVDVFWMDILHSMGVVTIIG
ncbi:hypothetical protein PHISCL_00401 [Aspergillus sclerotialis]|uniref:Zn(2)-C6 fungal-type domain-containing protein n=1 Tax=Aspergillus sclerotialis TaxID=2070753 RepID=A0A3A2ZX56_9EURO|nr:hypothetical protein PHISCL_00401 [Aspergillus sclerotialis]